MVISFMVYHLKTFLDDFYCRLHVCKIAMRHPSKAVQIPVLENDLSFKNFSFSC